MYLSLDKRIQFAIIFLPLKDSHPIPDMGFFYYALTCFVAAGVIEYRVSKINSNYFNRKLWPFHLSWLINSIFICSSS